MVSSWDKQFLNHVNRDVDIFQNGVLVAKSARVINIDLIGKRIILRKDRGEGAQISIWGGAIVIHDIENYRPGRTEYEEFKSPEEVLSYY